MASKLISEFYFVAYISFHQATICQRLFYLKPLSLLMIDVKCQYNAAIKLFGLVRSTNVGTNTLRHGIYEFADILVSCTLPGHSQQ